MKIIYEEHNGRRYAYRATSRRVPGVKNPVSEKEYLGVVDPDTGRLIPKKGTEGILDMDGRYGMKDYGSVLIIRKVLEDLGLDRVFDVMLGEDSRLAMAILASQILRPSPMWGITYTMDMAGIEEAFGSGKVSNRRIRSFFDSVDPTTAESMLSEKSKTASYTLLAPFPLLLGNTPILVTKYGIVAAPQEFIVLDVCMDADGEVRGIQSSSSVEQSFSDHLTHIMCSEYSGLPLVLGVGESKPKNVAEAISKGFDVIAVCATEHFELNFFQDTALEERSYNGDTYYVQEGASELIVSEGGWRFIGPADRRFDSSGAKLKSFVCYDPRIHHNDVKVIRGMLEIALSRSRSIEPGELEQWMEGEAGWLSNILRLKKGKDGTAGVTVIKSKLRELEKSLGRFVVVTTLDDEEEVFDALAHANPILGAIRDFYAEITDTWSPSLYSRDRPFMILQLVAIMVRAKIDAVLSESGRTGMKAKDLFMWTSSYRSMDTGYGLIRSSKSRDVEELLALFGVDDTSDAARRFRAV